MTIRNLGALFYPRSVALIGASTRAHSVGAVIAANLRAGGFEGPILPVNPKHQSVAGTLAYPDVASLPIVPDMAIICTPAPTVPGLIAELGARGTKGAVVISAGLDGDLRQAMLLSAKPHLLRIVGPNCLGILSTPSRLNASFAQTTPRPGKVAFVTQSGALLTTVLDWAESRGIGFSHLVSLGDMADVDFGDMLDYLANDDQTSAILLYVEAITHARKFMSAARAAARIKPVIAIKSGRQSGAAKAAASHTGALAGNDAVYDAAFRRAGILRVGDVDEVFDAVETLSYRLPIDGVRLTILTNGGGLGVLAADALASTGGVLASLSAVTGARLNTVLPATWSHGNPVDIIGDANANRYQAALAILSSTREQDAILVLNCPTAVGDSVEAATAVAAKAQLSKVPILASWVGTTSAARARSLFAAAKVPAYDTPEKATRGFMHMARDRSTRRLLLEVPSASTETFSANRARAGAIVKAAPAGWLAGDAAQELLACYGIPFVRTQRATTPEGAAKAAAEFGVPVALKVISRDVLHKSEVGGVALGIVGPENIASAARQMASRVAAAVPNARIDGFLIQEMVHKPHAFELIVGMANDPTFGPFLLFGQGGTAVEIINDKAIGLPPLNETLAADMIARTRISRQLKGYRDRPPADMKAVAQTIAALSQLVCEHLEIAEVDINPLLADEQGVVAADARVKLATPATRDRLAIRPYPAELAREESIPDVGAFHLRPIRPEDATALTKFVSRLTPDDLHMRFFCGMKGLPRTLLARLTQIDYDREMALLLIDRANDIAAVGRIAANPDNIAAEIALAVRSDLQHHGLGTLLMKRLASYASARGIKTLWGDILPENTKMISLCRLAGCHIERSPRDPATVRATLSLSARDSA